MFLFCRSHHKSTLNSILKAIGYLNNCYLLLLMSILKLIAHKTLSIEIQDGRHEGHQNEAKVIYYGMGTLKFLFSAS